MIKDQNKGLFYLALALVGLLALGMRWYYLTHSQVYQPIRGDAAQYYSYAWNLVNHQTFSNAVPNSAVVDPDSYRDPGYPLFLAAWMSLVENQNQWYSTVLLAQGLLGGLFALLLMLLARPWLGLKWLLPAGVITALWPHGITINGYLLSETLLGFLVLLGLLLVSTGLRRRSLTWTIAGGVTLSAAGLTNAVLLPFAPLVAAGLWIGKPELRKLAVFLLVAALALPGAWAVRNSQLPASDSAMGRAGQNLVQGSWPEYHDAYIQSINGDPAARQTMDQIDQEILGLATSPFEGGRKILQRMGQRPVHYIGWYLSKPVLLWGWDIRIGQGDIYVYPTPVSPFETHWPYRLVVAICHGLNGLLLVLMVVGVGFSWPRLRQGDPIAMLVSGCVVFVTLVYCVFQSEPRYSIAFRPLEILLACVGLEGLWRMVQAKVRPRDTDA
jgi:4-amino-4-deoxy-L-arabinose transferase-like glycosyltransferase